MICPQCNAEFREGFTVCSDCGVTLVEIGGAPEGEAVEPVGELALEPFHETWSSDELGVLLESLEESGIPYVVQAGTALSLLTSSALSSPELPEEWHARILVASSSVRQAREILRLLRLRARNPAQESTRPDRGVLS